ncbi:MAG TPA: hypothetical protein VHV10_08240, partial [Ktedonobacteraceae bacterium]|nr:hypothetical protein [Ktedonobacteraceae bacterium]
QGLEAFEADRAWKFEKALLDEVAIQQAVTISLPPLSAQAEGLAQVGFSIGIQGPGTLDVLASWKAWLSAKL